ncbi:MAG: Beta-glucanase/Beta-glucan synthetase [Pedosphaera sp.]|nr:Beta-glucanase/Beta-glucan synthetase [Pedosphaera sp.]
MQSPLNTFARLLLGLCIVFPLTGLAAPGDRPGWKLTFADEFNGSQLDTNKWNLQDPWGRERNLELQAYVKDAFETVDGILRIKAEKRPAFYAGKERNYTSGMLTTYGKFSQRYGRFEIRCRIPKGKGMWPAFWLLPDPLGWPPEIDILEILGHEPGKLYMTHHFRNDQRQHKSHGGQWAGPDFSKEFHEFAVEWTPQEIKWLVDGIERCHSTDSIPQTKMYILLNLAVGGDWPGAPDDQTHFPAAFEVDYVRVYEQVP